MTTWFGVSVLLKCCSQGDLPENWLWEKRVYLILAPSKEEAGEAALLLAKSTDHSFVSVKGCYTEWKTQEIFGTFEIDYEVLKSGTEVYSQLLKTQEVESMKQRFPKDF
jgi:hypothetical protein